MQILKDLKPAEVRLRAYLNRANPPKGFEGNRSGGFDFKLRELRRIKEQIELELGDIIKEIPGETYERRVSEFYLSRYAWAYMAFGKLFDIAPTFFGANLEEVEEHCRLGNRRVPAEMILHYAHAYDALKLRTAKQALLFDYRGTYSMDEKVAAKVNGYFLEVIKTFIAFMEDAVSSLIEAETVNGLMRDLRRNKLAPFIYDGLAHSVDILLITKDLTGEDLRALTYLKKLLVMEAINWRVKLDKQEEFDEGRIVFTPEDQVAWNYLRERLWNGLNVDVVLEAIMLRVGEEEFAKFTEREKLEIIRTNIGKMIEKHHRYGFREEVDFGGFRFIAEASPFTEKPVASPVGDLELVLYPVDDGMKNALREITDPSYEHADGSALLLPFSIREGGVVIEEVQTDVPELVKRKGIEMPPALSGLVGQWTDIAIEAAKWVARRNGFSEVYAPTPFRIFRRYGDSIHPDKVSGGYFKSLSRKSSGLVFDDEGVLDNIKQHYWVFEA